MVCEYDVSLLANEFKDASLPSVSLTLLAPFLLSLRNHFTIVLIGTDQTAEAL